MLIERARTDFAKLAACIGVYFDKDLDSVVVDRILWNSSAHLSGLEAQDTVVSMTNIKITAQNFHRHFRVYRPGDIVGFEVKRLVKSKQKNYGAGRNDKTTETVKTTPTTIFIPVHIGAQSLRLDDVRNLRRIAEGTVQDSDWLAYCPFNVEDEALWRTEPANITAIPAGQNPAKYMYSSVTNCINEHYEWFDSEKAWQEKNQGQQDPNMLFI